jgi:hypothetical protein
LKEENEKPRRQKNERREKRCVCVLLCLSLTIVSHHFLFIDFSQNGVAGLHHFLESTATFVWEWRRDRDRGKGERAEKNKS